MVAYKLQVVSCYQQFELGRKPLGSQRQGLGKPKAFPINKSRKQTLALTLRTGADVKLTGNGLTEGV